MAVLRTNQRIDARFLKMLLETPIYQGRLLEDAGGSTIKHLYVSRLDKMPVAVPSRSAEREGIMVLLQSMAALLANNERDLRTLHRLKTGLMQDLLTGKVSVEPLLDATDTSG